MCDCCSQPICSVKKQPRPDLRLGAHVSKTDNLALRLETIPLQTIQIFAWSPQTYQCPQLKSSEKEKIRKVGKSFYVHCPYVANFGAEDEEKFNKAFKCIQQHLNFVDSIPASCVLHTGSIGSVQTIANRLNDLQFTTPTNNMLPLLLENASGEGRERGRDFEEFRKIFETIDHSKVGLCIDTQHLFGAGLCAFDSHEAVVKTFEEASNICSTGISLIHLNDSKCECGSKRDRHECIGKGHIWSKSRESLDSLLDMCRDCDMDMILETSDPLNDMNFINKIDLDKI